MRAGRSSTINLVGVVTLGAAAVLSIAVALSATQERPRADAGVQERIAQTVDAVVREDPAAGESFEALRQLAMQRRREVLLQMALYLSKSTGTERSMAGALVLQRLEFTPNEKIDVALANLEVEDPALHRVLIEVLGTIDRNQDGQPDFGVYEARLRKDRLSPPPELVRYIYETSPDAAVRVMDRVFGSGGGGAGATLGTLQNLLSRRDVSTAWSARELAEARAALETLGGDPAWWRRLYVATLLRRDPYLATPSLADRLRSDSNELVRGAIAP